MMVRVGLERVGSEQAADPVDDRSLADHQSDLNAEAGHDRIGQHGDLWDRTRPMSVAWWPFGRAAGGSECRSPESNWWSDSL